MTRRMGQGYCNNGSNLWLFFTVDCIHFIKQSMMYYKKCPFLTEPLLPHIRAFHLPFSKLHYILMGMSARLSADEKRHMANLFFFFFLFFFPVCSRLPTNRVLPPTSISNTFTDLTTSWTIFALFFYPYRGCMIYSYPYQTTEYGYG
jgi:hypothetical protein